MQLEPIIKVKLSRFRKVYEIETIQDGIAFERFANLTILTNHQPNAFTGSDDILNLINVGGHNDMGLDGLCIKLNGVLVRTLQDAQDIVSLHKNVDIEFIFIQSKYKDKFDSGEYSKFINGVTDFLGESHFQPRNSQIDHWLEIKDFLMSDDVMVNWVHNPNVRLYYVVMGIWSNSLHITAISQKFEQDITNLNTYGEINIKYVDTASFKKICDDNDNVFTSVINIIDTFSLTEVKRVDNSSIILCTAEELLRMLITEDRMIRKGLFNDNVRDYQGDTVINNEIYNTILKDPESFVLLNNGITIICDCITPGNRKITIKNPQIVNGCQTCNVIYSAFKNSIDLSNVVISAKIIATQNDDVTNKVVKGTNRQNIVYDETFEITREFHKNLEELFTALSVENSDKLKLYYERRSKQFANNSSIKPSQKVNFRILIQSFVSIFLNAPHQGHRHESKLLQQFKNKIFIDTQSKYPYYTATLIYSQMEILIKKNLIPKEIAVYKAHICMLVKLLLLGKSPSINDEKLIDKYCEKLIANIKDDKLYTDAVRKSIKLFVTVQRDWVAEKGESYKYGIKDSAEFTDFLLQRICPAVQNVSTEKDSLQFRGTVVKIGYDRYGAQYGFITKSPQNIFFHAADNSDLNFNNLLQRDVVYTVVTDKITNLDKAVNIQVIH